MKEFDTINITKEDVEPKKYNGFMFLPSYRSAYDCLIREGEPELATLLLQAIVYYGTEEKIITQHPRIELAMTTIRPVMDKGRNEHKAKQKAKEMVQYENALARRTRTTDFF